MAKIGAERLVRITAESSPKDEKVLSFQDN